MPHQELVEDLLHVADNTEQLTARAMEVEDVPLPIRAGIADRLMQLTGLIRLLARQLDSTGEKTANIPVDGTSIPPQKDQAA